MEMLPRTSGRKCYVGIEVRSVTKDSSVGSVTKDPWYEMLPGTSGRKSYQDPQVGYVTKDPR